MKLIPDINDCQLETTFDETNGKLDPAGVFTFNTNTILFKLEDQRTELKCPCMKVKPKETFTTAKGEDLAVRECIL